MGLVVYQKDGFEFINKKTYDGLGVYHAHISEHDKGVLIWYMTYDEYGYIVNFEYIVHPKNDVEYKNIINNIYNLDNSYHHIKQDYLMNLYKLLKENVITSFENFELL